MRIQCLEITFVRTLSWERGSGGEMPWDQALELGMPHSDKLQREVNPGNDAEHKAHSFKY